MISVQGVTKSFGAKLAVDNVTFSVPDGCITGFVGPNGAGKTTIMKMITGLLSPDSGTVTVDGEDFASKTLPSSSVGALISAEWLPGRLTASTILGYACRTQGISIQRANVVLEMVGMGGYERARVRTFSLGMRQRLGLALALVGNPQNLILDEPINGLDPDGVRWLRDFLQSQSAAGRAILLSSHVMSELELVAEDVVVLTNGQVNRRGKLAELASTGDGVYVESPDIVGLETLLEANGCTVMRQGLGIMVTGVDALTLGRIAFNSGPGLTHISARRVSLEEIYLGVASPSQPLIAISKEEA